MGIQPEIRVKRRHGGNQSSNWPLPLLSRKAFCTFLIVHRDQWVIQNYAVLAAQTLTKTRLFSLHTQLYTQVLGDLYHLLAKKGQLTFYRLFSDKGLLTGRLICVDLPKVWCHSQKALKKKLHSYIAKIQQFITSKRSTVIYNKRKVTNSKVQCC